MTPPVDFGVDLKRRNAPGMLRDDDLGAAGVEVGNYSVGVKGLVGDQAAELDVLDQRRDADSIEPMARQQDEADQVSQRIGERQEQRREWFEGQIDLDPERLVFIDERRASNRSSGG